MAIPPNMPAPDISKRQGVLDKARLAFLIVLMALLGMCLAFIWTTRGAMQQLSFLRQKSGESAAGGNQTNLVDQRPWQTAQTLAALAVTAEETDLAHQAERLADHEVDQAFASALRVANLKAEHRAFTGEALALSQRVEQLKQLVAQDQAQVDRLSASPSPKTPNPQAAQQSASNSDDLDLSKAQLQLDSDELTDAQQNLARAVGDNRDEIQTELAAREAAMRKYDTGSSENGETAVISAARRGTLASRLTGWFNQRDRYRLIQQALTEAQNEAQSLTGLHNALEAKANASASTASGAADRSSQLADLKNRSAERQLLSIYDDRIQTERQLASVYAKWSDQVLLQHSILLHLILQSFAVILCVLICMLVGDALVRRLMAALPWEQRQIHTLSSVVELSIQVLGLLIILLYIFGWPHQMPTILGLVTAGITIVLQDFILAFFGWFVLMGKNGIRIGDRVEINSVSGEVTEIGLMSTTLLETGNLTNNGLPTGRRISFMNGFAIRGQFFNFSTAGQWLWDEIAVSLPASADTQDLFDSIQKAAQEQTRDDAALAAQEWRRAARSEQLSKPDATPLIYLVPTASGSDVHIRFVTRASQRSEARNALQRRVFSLIQSHSTPAPSNSEAMPAGD
jgi:small-conductance mechanosensitive channel